MGSRISGGARRRNKRGRQIESLESRCLLAAEAVISEFMAVNESRIADSDGDFSDWIEISNAGDEPLRLDGWHLTDDVGDKSKWTFPDVTLNPNQQLIVYASDKDRRDPAGELHANFRLSSNGEYLGLVQPDGEVADAYAPEYPEQYSDVSYGVAASGGAAGYFGFASPGSLNILSPQVNPPTAIVINEVMYHPASNNDADEYIELVNIGSTTIDLEGWRISGGIDMVLPAVSVAPVNSSWWLPTRRRLPRRMEMCRSSWGLGGDG